MGTNYREPWWANIYEQIWCKPTLYNNLYAGSIIESEARPTDMQLKWEAKLKD